MNIKQKYVVPEILVICLDNEISLHLESDPPIPENEEITVVREFFEQNPFNPRNC